MYLCSLAYCPSLHTTRYGVYNRFIVTSRIVGYEAAGFDSYAHYTLLDLEDEQIEQFLTNWFLAVGRRLTQGRYGTEKLLPQQEEEAQNWGTEQRELLLNAIKSNPGVKRLAINPLSLTILALSLLSEGKALPHRRINLYQKVTLLFLDNQNQGTGRKTFSKKEVRLAEQILSRVAYQLHSNDRPLTAQEVKEITRETMADFYKLPVEQIDPDDRVEPFIETLRRSSGLFVETGPDFFVFMHRAFQEYYVAMYLSSQPLEELINFVREHYSKPLWREPLLLLIASKSEKNQSVNESDTPQQADVLLRAILNTTERCDTFLQRNLLFAATSLLDCDAGKIDKVLQQDIANHLFDLYDDSFSGGRFIQLQQDVEKVVLLWLQEQPSDSRTPLLEGWSSALCDDKNRVRQGGAVRLLAALAPDCPRSVLQALIPPLLQLAEALDISYPPEEIQKQLPKPAACPSSLNVQEYAFVALCLFDAAGPADWLYQKWFKWSQEHPDSLGRLNEHAHDLQIQLLHTNNRARYPYTYLFWRLLKEELEASNDVSWRIVWDAVLQEEMTRGHSATYQSCLYLRLLLWKGNKEQNQKIAHELMKALLAADQQQIQAITFITNIYLLGLLNLLEPPIMGSQEFDDSQEVGEPLDLLYLYDFRKFPEQLDLQKLRDLRSLRDIASSQVPLNLILYFLRFRDPLNLTNPSIGFAQRQPSPLEDLDIPNLLTSLDLQDLLRNMQVSLRDLRDLQEPLDLRLMRVLLDVRDDLDLQVLLDLRTFLDRDYIAEILCNIPVQQSNDLPARVLLAFYSIILGDTSVPPSLGQQIQASIQASRRQAQSLTKEHSLLITAISRLLHESAAPDVISVPSLSETPDQRATALQTLQQEDQLTKSQVEGILAACTDTRELSEEAQKEVEALTVQQAAWQVLDRPFSIEEKSVPVVVQALSDTNTIVCTAAALLLQRASTVPAGERDKAVEKILAFLTDDESSRRPLELPDYTRNWQLSEVLFETLKVLAEGEG